MTPLLVGVLVGFAVYAVAARGWPAFRRHLRRQLPVTGRTLRRVDDPHPLDTCRHLIDPDRGRTCDRPGVWELGEISDVLGDGERCRPGEGVGSFTYYCSRHRPRVR